MNTTGHEGMLMDGYSFMGMHWFWWGSILIFALILLAAAHLYKKRK
ncbi:hypothetical protein SAMN04488062_101339 [Flavobacterium omnivorum]|jgi:hypothetical protein|uniref:Uncharacterized protein n=1 Tax=Flavobacterium omnivorum TaxID=178355 RepID=A0A1G7W624_9FLAO|nr:hypothetical protein [Flavobacterium omnivorum]SDG67445.1 hypothetical protein SAMN04488062_101339 [Flavobacterium omnivorum]